MLTNGCYIKFSCTLSALIASFIVGVLTVFFQITGVITLTPVFLWVILGISIVYLGILVLSAALLRRTVERSCVCSSLNTLLSGILGTILFALVLLAVGIVATSILSAILAGILLFFFALALTNTACLIRCLADCGSCDAAKKNRRSGSID